MHRTQTRFTSLLASLSCLLWVACSPGNKPIQTSDGMLIEPGVGVGPVKLGMKMEDVRKLFGEPDVRIANTMQYNKLGFAVLPKKPTEVGAIMMGDSGGSFLVDAFKGETQDGIRMGSTRQAIVDVYGEPVRSPVDKFTAAEEAKQGVESLDYRDLGLRFVLKDDRLVHVTLR